MLHSLSVSLLSGSYKVCVRYVAAAEEVFESFRHIGAKGQGIFPCSISSLLNFQAMFVCAWNEREQDVFLGIRAAIINCLVYEMSKELLHKCVKISKSLFKLLDP